MSLYVNWTSFVFGISLATRFASIYVGPFVLEFDWREDGDLKDVERVEDAEE